jgi:Protein of unknown function (DUF1579)
MKRTLIARLTPLALALALPAFAQQAAPEPSAEQQAMMAAYEAAAEPGPAHAALARMAGGYDLAIKSWNSPTGEPTFESGTATRRMTLGGRVMVEEMQASMMGQAFTGIGMHGYDNVSGKHWSTWNDNLSTGLMVSEGSCDEAGTCTFTGTWNDPVSRKPVTARMTSRWTSDTVEVFEMYGPGPDGKETKMMEITYTKRP